MHRKRPLRIDPEVVLLLTERLLGLAIPSTVAYSGSGADPLDIAQRLLTGFVPDLDAQIEHAREIVDVLYGHRSARYGKAGIDTWTFRDDVAAIAELARADVAAGARDLNAAWRARRIRLAQRDADRTGHAFPYAPPQIWNLKGVYLAYAADERRRTTPSGLPRIAASAVRGLLTKPLLLLPDEGFMSYRIDYYAEGA